LTANSARRYLSAYLSCNPSAGRQSVSNHHGASLAMARVGIEVVSPVLHILRIRRLAGRVQELTHRGQRTVHLLPEAGLIKVIDHPGTVRLRRNVYLSSESDNLSRFGDRCVLLAWTPTTP
jgi:hypothetical protein